MFKIVLVEISLQFHVYEFIYTVLLGADEVSGESNIAAS
jgi:hypothetical protein